MRTFTGDDREAGAWHQPNRARALYPRRCVGRARGGHRRAKRGTQICRPSQLDRPKVLPWRAASPRWSSDRAGGRHPSPQASGRSGGGKVDVSEGFDPASCGSEATFLGGCTALGSTVEALFSDSPSGRFPRIPDGCLG